MIDIIQKDLLCLQKWTIYKWTPFLSGALQVLSMSPLSQLLYNTQKWTPLTWQVQDTKVQGFVPGMKLECMDRTSLETDTYWVATVVMASGPLLLLRYDGYDDDRSGDFWCDAASDDLQPIGWCARNNTILIPPAGRKWKIVAVYRRVGGTWLVFGYKGSAEDLKPGPCLQQGKFQKHTLHGKTYFVPCPSLRQSTTWE